MILCILRSLMVIILSQCIEFTMFWRLRYYFIHYIVGQCHWICLATANIGWPAAMTGTWPGLRDATRSLILFLTCFAVATSTKWAWSHRRGSSNAMLISNSGLLVWEAWWADYATSTGSSVTVTFCSHSYSIARCGCSKLVLDGSVSNTYSTLRRRRFCLREEGWLDVGERGWKLWNTPNSFIMQAYSLFKAYIENQP